MNNTTKMLLPVTALCLYFSGCVAYETPVYHRTPTYVTEPAYAAPVTYSTTTYVTEPVYIDHGYRHHGVGHTPPHGKHGGHKPVHNSHVSHGHKPAPGPQKSHNPQHATSKATVQNKKAVHKSGPRGQRP